MGRESHPSLGVGVSAEGLLRETAGRRVTGVLEVTHRGGEVSHVWLRDGDIYSLTVAGYRPALGIRLLSGGVISPDQLSTAVSEQRNRLAGRRMGEVLVELGFVAADLIEAVLLEQVHDQLADLLDLPMISSALHVGRRISQDTFTPHPMGDLLELASDRRKRRVGLLREVGGPDVVPKLGPQGRGSAQTPLGPRDWALLCRVDGRRNLAELGRICGFTVFETAEVMSALATAGLVVLPDPPVEEEPPLAPVLQLPLEASPSGDWAFSDGGIGEPEPLIGAPELNQRVAEDDLSIALAPVAEKWEPPVVTDTAAVPDSAAGSGSEAAGSELSDPGTPDRLADEVVLGGPWEAPAVPSSGRPRGAGGHAARSALAEAAGALAQFLAGDDPPPHESSAAVDDAAGDEPEVGRARSETGLLADFLATDFAPPRAPANARDGIGCSDHTTAPMGPSARGPRPASTPTPSPQVVDVNLTLPEVVRVPPAPAAPRAARHARMTPPPEGPIVITAPALPPAALRPPDVASDCSADQVVVVASESLSIASDPRTRVPEPRRSPPIAPPIVVESPPRLVPSPAPRPPASAQPSVLPQPITGPAVAQAQADADTTAFMRELAGLSDAPAEAPPAAEVTRQVVPLSTPPPPKKRHFWSR